MPIPVTAVIALLMLACSLPARACFVNGSTCSGERKLFEQDILLGETGGFRLQCSNACIGDVVIETDGRVVATPGTTTVNGTPQTVALTPTGLSGKAHVFIGWMCEVGGGVDQGTCSGEVTVQPPPVDIVDIHPIQVVQDPPHEVRREDIPMVQDKRTIVRVFVSLPPDVTQATNVRAELDWNGETFSITADLLVRVFNRTWVLTRSDVETFWTGEGNSPSEFTASEAAELITTAIADNRKPRGSDSGRYFAYNFTFGEGKKMPSSLTLTARLYREGQTEPMATATEESGDTFKIKSFKGSLSSRFTAWVAPYYVDGDGIKRRRGRRSDTYSDAQMRSLIVDKTDQVRREFLSNYPIPESKIYVYPRHKITVSNPVFSDVDNLSNASGVPSYFNQFTAGISNSNSSVDSMILITGGREVMSDRGYTPLLNRRVHFVRVDQSAAALVAAHETAHDPRFYGAGHVNTLDTVQGIGDQITGKVTFIESLVQIFSQVEDGWDAGKRVHRGSTRSYFKLMLDGSYGTETKRWVGVETYRKLLTALVDGGPDPLLVSLSGVISAGGSIPPGDLQAFVYMGLELLPQSGAGTLTFRDEAGSTLGTTPVALNGTSWDDPTARNDGIRLFNVSAVVPDGTTTISLTAAGSSGLTLFRSENDPTITVDSVLYDALTEQVLGSFSAADADGDTLLFTGEYTCDQSTGFIALPPEAFVLDEGAGAFNLDVSELPGGGSCRVRVSASDGLRLAQGTSNTFSVPDRVPTGYIAEVFDNGQPIALEVVAFDREDGADLSVVWSSDNSEETDPENPAAGVTYTAQVTDSASNALVLDFTARDPARPTFDPVSGNLRIPVVNRNDASVAEAWTLRLDDEPGRESLFLLENVDTSLLPASFDTPLFDPVAGTLLLSIDVLPEFPGATGSSTFIILNQQTADPDQFTIACPSEFADEFLLQSPCDPSSAPGSLRVATSAYGARGLELVFSADNGNGIITEYAASCDDGTVTVASTANGPSVLLPDADLDPAATYTCIGTATNAFGISEPSRPYWLARNVDPRETLLHQIQLIYIGLLERGADFPGFDYWLRQIQAGLISIDGLRFNIVNFQPEYIAGLGQLDRAGVVTALYRNMFNRDPELEGFNYWVFGGGAPVPVDSLVLALIFGAGPTDLVTLQNKAQAATYYTNFYNAYRAEDAKAAVENVDSTGASLDAARDLVDSLN